MVICFTLEKSVKNRIVVKEINPYCVEHLIDAQETLFTYISIDQLTISYNSDK